MVVGVGVMMVPMSMIIASAVWSGRVVEVSVVVVVVVVVVALADKGESSWVRGS